MIACTKAFLVLFLVILTTQRGRCISYLILHNKNHSKLDHRHVSSPIPPVGQESRHRLAGYLPRVSHTLQSSVSRDYCLILRLTLAESASKINHMAVGRPQVLLTVGWTLLPCHVGLSIGQATTWVLSPLRVRARENV